MCSFASGLWVSGLGLMAERRSHRLDETGPPSPWEKACKEGEEGPLPEPVGTDRGRPGERTRAEGQEETGSGCHKTKSRVKAPRGDSWAGAGWKEVELGKGTGPLPRKGSDTRGLSFALTWHQFRLLGGGSRGECVSSVTGRVRPRGAHISNRKPVLCTDAATCPCHRHLALATWRQALLTVHGCSHLRN